MSDVEYIDRAKILRKIGGLSTAWEYGQAVQDIYAMVKAEPLVYVEPVVYANGRLNMKFRNPETGVEFRSILSAMDEYCESHCEDGCERCKIRELALEYRGYPNRCSTFCIENPCEAAGLMGYEVVDGHYGRLCEAAKHFGLDIQKQKTKEEMDELAELLGDYSVPDRALRAARIEELADVYNMLDQLCILWDCEDEVKDTAERKMERTMERIASGYYEGKANG